MRLTVNNVAVCAETIGRFATHLKTIFGIFHEIVDVRMQFVCAECRFVHRIQFRFGEPPHFVCFNWNVIVQRFVPLQFHLMACNRYDARVEDGAQNGRFGGKCDFSKFRRMFIEYRLANAGCRMQIVVRLIVGEIGVDVAIDIGMYWIRNTVHRMNLNGVRCDRFQIIDRQFGVVECFAGRNEYNIRIACRTFHTEHNVATILGIV